MMVDAALNLAAQGFHVFPCKRNKKLPAIDDFPNRATSDPEQIRKMWGGHSYNIGISTSHFGDDQALVVIDVDTKKGKNGDETLLGLELQGFDIPLTIENETPNGGRHLIYVTEHACKQGTDVLGAGLDIRSRGGYILGPGSVIDGKAYTQINGHGTLAPCPAWLIDRLGVDRRNRDAPRDPVAGVDPHRAEKRALIWLKDYAPLAVEGEAGDQTTFKVAAALKDYGCTEAQTLLLLWEEWNDRCSPPWSPDDLEAKVRHAFKYGSEAPGSAAPEAVFAQTEPDPEEPESGGTHPFDKINEQYAFVKQGAYILQETTDEDGAFITERLLVAEFHAWFANQPFPQAGQKPRPISMHWMESSRRRQYEGVVFAPEQDRGPRWYNLWRGFTVKPAPVANHPSLDAFLEHALVNVCGGDQDLFRYLIGYFAHMIQRPWEKPLVALVFKGAKGVGKNALVERVGFLLGPHFLVADDERYLLGNFNSHLESNLCFVLNEAAWAGDKRAEGKLKGLITESKHLIEFKNKEPRAKKSLTRVMILGNEDWIVPATVDERRFAVFNVGNGRRQDRKFFIDMREGMERGGYAHLLRYLMDFDLSIVDINDAPKTQALVEQVIAGLDPLSQWWFDCLISGSIAGGDWGGEWPDGIPTNRLRDAYARWAKSRNIRSRLDSEESFGRQLAKIAPNFKKRKRFSKVPNDTSYAYVTPGLDQLRADWAKHLGGSIEWPE